MVAGIPGEPASRVERTSCTYARAGTQNLGRSPLDRISRWYDNKAREDRSTHPIRPIPLETPQRRGLRPRERQIQEFLEYLHL